MITPEWEELFAGLEGLAIAEHSYPYQYQDLSLIKLFVYARIEGIKGFQTLQKYLELRADIVELLGLCLQCALCEQLIIKVKKVSRIGHCLILSKSCM